MTSAEPEPAWRRVCTVAELEAAGRLERLVERRAVLLLWIDGAPVATAALCPHAAAPLIEGSIKDGRLHCARHLASFDLVTGAVDGGWVLPPLRIYAVRTVEGFVEIGLG